MIGTFTSMMFMICAMVCRNVRGNHGFRWYSVNLMLVNLVVMLMIVANDKDLYSFVKSNISQSTYSHLKSYNSDIVELSNIVYVSTSTVLIIDTTYRYRRDDYSGFTHKQWFALCSLADLVPLSFVIVQVG